MDGWNLDESWMELGWKSDGIPDEPCSTLDGMSDGIHGNVLHFGVRYFKKNTIIVIVYTNHNACMSRPI